MSKIIFFTGKGGVGKSTLSALSALNLSNFDKQTLLISLDPAHNLQDIFQTGFSEKAKTINHKLSVVQIDIEKQTKNYLKDTIKKMERIYQYQSAFSLKNYFKLLKHAPGMEEYALLQAFNQIIDEYPEKEYLIFDMPPTALSLRFFSLPGNSLVWIEELSKLRKAILEKKEIITKIKFGKKEIETDKVNNQLHVLNKEHAKIQNILKSENSKINIVLNPDDLSINEAHRIKKSLDDLQLSVFRYIQNKCISDVDNQKIAFKALTVPFSNTALTGLDQLQKFIKEMQLTDTLKQCIE